MMSQTSIIFFLLSTFLNMVGCATIYDPTQLLEIYFSANSAQSRQYAVSITAQSLFQDSFFKFISITPPPFPEFLNVIDLTSVTKNFTLQYRNLVPQDPNITPDPTCVTQTFLDCTIEPVTQTLCSILKPLPPIESIHIIDLQDLNCITLNGNALCNLQLNGVSLSDGEGNLIFRIQDNICPGSLISIIIKVSVLKAYLPPSHIVGRGSLTFHFHSVTLKTSNSWMVSGSLSRVNEPSEVTTGLALEALTEPEYPEDHDLNTIIKTQLLRHDYPKNIYCRYKITFTGFIRGIYVNSYPSSIHSPRGIGLDIESTVESNMRLPLRANQYNLVSIIGYRINKTELEFFDCKEDWTDGLTLLVHFSTYNYDTQVLAAQDYTIQETNYACPRDCNRCTGDNFCISCRDYLAKGQCFSNCPSDFPNYDHRKICNTVQERGALLFQPIQVSQNEATIWLYNEISPLSPFSVTVHSTQDILFGATTWLSGVQLLPESISTFIPQLQYGVNTIFIPTNNLSPSLDPTIVTVAYNKLDEAPNNFLGIFWQLEGRDPTSQSEKQSFQTIFYSENKRAQYLEQTGFYVIEALVNCTVPCEVQVTSDGRVQAFKNYRTLLFDVTFVSKWTYTYPNIAGFTHLRFVVRRATFFRPSVVGQEVIIYPIGDLFFTHMLNLGSGNIASISNCINNKQDQCFSCEEGFFLSSDKKECRQTCDSSYSFNSIERVCKSPCGSNERVSLDGTECNPACDQLDHFYTQQKGCSICVPECAICADATTCGQCKFNDPSNNSTFCKRKIGSIFTSPNFNVNQNIQLMKDPGTNIAIIVTSKSFFSELAFFFTNTNSKKNPKIFKVIQMEEVSGYPNLAETNVPPLFIADSGEVTLHYLKIQEDFTAKSYSIAGFRRDAYVEWPMEDRNFPSIDSTVGLLEYNKTNELEKLAYEYETIIASRLYKHDQSASTLKCQLEVVYSGYIKGVYANDELILSDTTNDELTQLTTLSRSFIIESGELIMITFVGHRLQIQNTAMTNCKMETSPGSIVEVSPTFTTYVFSGSDALPDTFTVANNTNCSPSCLRCINDSHCLRCESNLLLVNGRCQTSCPNPNDYQVFPRFCDSSIRDLGFRMNTFYNNQQETFTALYVLNLGLDIEILAIIHPFVPSLTSHGAYVFIPDREPVIAEGAYQLLNYSASQTALVLDIPVKSEAVKDRDDFKLIVYTVRRNLMLLVCYTDFPVNLGQLERPESYQLIAYSNNKITLLASKVYFLDFFLNCDGQCQIGFQLEGNIQITLNERTYLFEGYIEPLGSVFLQRKLSGLNHILIKIWNTTEFQLTLIGSYSILTQGQIILNKNLVGIPIMQCTQTNCENCYKNRCLSCTEGYMLDQATGLCTNLCPIGTKGDLFQRMCGEAICSFSANSLFVGQGDYCVWNCLNYPHFYYNISEGCKGECAISCDLCSGPLESHCLSCSYPRLLGANRTCICPVGTIDNSAGGCASISFMNLSTSAIVLFCADAVVEAQIRTDELQAYNISFFWELTSSNSSLLSQAQLQSYLSAQHSKTIIIPQNLLERGKTYRFTGYYYNSLNLKINNSVEVETQPNTFILNLPLMRSYIVNNFRLELGSYPCLMDQYYTTWSVITGPLSASTIYVSPQDPLKFTIPARSLPANTNSTLKVRGYSKQDSNILIDALVNIRTMPEDFDVVVVTNSRDHPEAIDLNLKGRIDYYDHCELREVGRIQYSWSCNIANPSSVSGSCPDTNGIFGVARNTDSLTYPKNYFSNGDILTITLFVSKNGVTKNCSIDIQIRSYNTFIINLALMSNTKKYVNNKDYLLSASISTVSISGVLTNLTGDDFRDLNFQWNTYPTLPFVAFQNEMKILANSVQFPLNIDVIRIELSLTNSTHSGASSLPLSINRPPYGGSLSVFPVMGVSLTTNFTISLASWQDEDVPITYDVYYSFLQNNDFTPLVSTPTLNPEINALLPAQHQGGLLYIKVLIKDYFGAETITNTQIYVQPISLTFAQALEKYNNLLNSAEKSDSFSLVTLIGIISKDLTTWETELLKNIVNACPACSNRGSCLAGSNRCECDNEWGLPDCSLGEDLIKQVIQLKQRYLTDLSQAYKDIQGNLSLVTNNPNNEEENTYKQVLYQTLKETAKDEHFNTNTTLILIQNILEQRLKIIDPETTLKVPDEVVKISEILSSMLSYASAYDCVRATQFTKDLANKTVQYLHKLSHSSLSSKISRESATIIDTENINMYFQRLSICDLQNKMISGSEGSPKVTINLKSGATENCSLQIDLKYYAMNDSLLNCNKGSNESNTKDIISIEFSDPLTGSNLNLNVSITISPTNQCPSVCIVLADQSCTCDNLSPFDLESQIIKIFEVSNLSNRFKITALLQFQFWKAASFWGIALFTSWFVATFFIVKFKIPTYNILDHFKPQHIKNKLRLFWTAILVTHPLLSVYCVKQRNFSKTTRATLYFSRNIFLLALTSAFSESSSDTEFEFKLFDFNLYLMILPYFTVIPVCGFLTWLMESHSIKEQEIKGEPGWKRSWIKNKIRVGYALTFGFLLLGFGVILIINANFNDVQLLMWTVDFITSLAQDLFITPFLFIIIQYALFRLYYNKDHQKSPKIRKMVSLLLDQHLRELRETVTHLISGSDQDHPTQFAYNKNIFANGTVKCTSFSDMSSLKKDKTSKCSLVIRRESFQKKFLEGLSKTGTILEVSFDDFPHRIKPEIKVIECKHKNKEEKDFEDVSFNTPELQNDLDGSPDKAVKSMLKMRGSICKTVGEEYLYEGSNEEKRMFKSSIDNSCDHKMMVDILDSNQRGNQNRLFGSRKSSNIESHLDSPQTTSSPEPLEKSIQNIVLESSDKRKQQYQRLMSTVSPKQSPQSYGRRSLGLSELDGSDKAHQEGETFSLVKILKPDSTRHSMMAKKLPPINYDESLVDCSNKFEEDTKQQAEKVQDDPLFQFKKSFLNVNDDKESQMTVIDLQFQNEQKSPQRTLYERRFSQKKGSGDI